MRDVDTRIAYHEIVNLSQLFYLRTQRTPDAIAYRYYDKTRQRWQNLSWHDMANEVGRWQTVLRREQLAPGDRVGIMINNCPTWVVFEQAAMGLGLVVVPLYTNDRAENVSYIIEDAQIRMLLLETNMQWQNLKPLCKGLKSLKRILCLEPITEDEDLRLLQCDIWLPEKHEIHRPSENNTHKSSLATIVYTSGTTGKPKGVMLSHENIFWDACAGIKNITVYNSDSCLSFLPLSHMFERTVGYYLPMICGFRVTYARSINDLAEDLIQQRPSILITVPRIFERVYNKINIQLSTKSRLARHLFDKATETGWYRFRYQQGKARWHLKLLLWPILNILVARKISSRLGGKLRVAISGGAPLAFDIARFFISLGVVIAQGYGLTEASPVISVNTLEDNEPDSVGQLLPGIEAKLGNDDELMIRGLNVMMGYWNQDETTQQIIDPDGWLHTGDKVDIKRDHIYITGRIKEILVLSNGEKIPPADIEMAICADPHFEQALVIGEAKPYLVALLVLNQEKWESLANDLGVTKDTEMLNHPSVQHVLMEKIQCCTSSFPGYAKIINIHVTLEGWTIENDLMTPTMKLKRQRIIDLYTDRIEQLYEGH